jgi:hypothetical protein
MSLWKKSPKLLPNTFFVKINTYSKLVKQLAQKYIF